MDTRVDARSCKAVLFSWLVAALAVPVCLLAAAVGQGAGAWLGGCTWIGLSLPLDRHIWALVNEPVMNFVSTSAAIPYWLGSLVLPLLLAATLVPLVPRARTLAGELLMVQLSWMSALVGGAWLPLLDPVDGHLVRLLGFRMLSAHLVWLAPCLAAATVLPATLRVIGLALAADSHLGRVARVGVVATHFLPPAVVWIGLVSVLRGELPIAATVAALLPLLAALCVAWTGYPSPFVNPLQELEAMSFVRAVAVLLILSGLLFFAGGPRADDHRSGLLWAAPDGFNNVRPWIEPWGPPG